jgi:endonuclease/exonuclease/phosphatase family metal-dependent hydrolase
MNGKKYRCTALIVTVVLLSSCFGCNPDPEGREITVMSWNVQNLFDASDDGTEYYEYSPAGGWDIDDYRSRLAAVAEVVRLAVKGGADVVLLLEVENGGVLDELADSFLRGMSYPYRAATAGAGSAVQVAVLSRIPILSVRSHTIFHPSAPPLRPVLEVELGLESGESMVLFGSHWKSKSGGAEESEPWRIAAAELLRGEIGRLASRGVPVVLAGDLNEAWDEAMLNGGAYPVALVPFGDWTEESAGLPVSAERAEAGTAGKGLPLYTPWGEFPPDTGSYRYRDVWERIDHVLLTGEFFNGTGVEYAGFETAADTPWCDNDGYPLAYRTRDGFGYSDHLPLVLRLLF